MARIERWRLFAVDLPFRRPFKHAAAERVSSSSLYLELQTQGGARGFGECLPRPYVTGETREGTFALLRDEILPRLQEMELGSLAEAVAFLRECNGKAPVGWVAGDPPQTAAWCAVDLALLDALGREFGEAVRLGDGPCPAPSLRYSVVVSADRGLKLVKTLLMLRAFGIRQVKLKVTAGNELEEVRRVRRWLGRARDLRVDANMAWTADQALALLPELARLGVSSIEQPLAAEDLEGLAQLVAAGGPDIMIDESLHDAASLERAINARACTAVNVRISKCGGLIAAHARCQEARAAGLKVQIGCQVGESSLLSAAHIILASAVEDLGYAEGCFGKLLLREDPAGPILQFGRGGKPPELPGGDGLGIHVDEDVLRRWTSDVAESSREQPT